MLQISFFFVSLKSETKNKKQMSKETQDGLKSHFGLTKVHKVGKTNKGNKIVRIEHYKELSFNAVLTQMKKSERTEKRRNERQKYRRAK